jgi:hemolysin activation/secretion protein
MRQTIVLLPLVLSLGWNASVVIAQTETDLFSDSSQTSQENQDTIKEIEVLGSTVFGKDELNRVTDPFIGKPINRLTRQEIEKAVIDFYVNAGYTTSGAYSPPQDVSKGKITIQVVEGSLEQLEINGLSHLQESYVRSRLELATDTPLDINRIQEALQLLQLNPLFESVRGRLKRGTATGLNVLVVDVVEAPALKVGVSFDNASPPSIGEYRGTASIAHQNLLGVGDRFSTSYSFTEGLDRYNVSYKIPFNAKDGSIEIAYVNGQNQIVEQFEEVELRSQSNIFSISVRQPIILKPTEELALYASLDLQESQTYLFNDIPFSFTIGPENGKSRITALRLGQEYISRSDTSVLALRSQFSIGLDWFDATINESGRDGDFFSWQGQIQWVEKLDEDITFLVQASAQITPDSLLPIEQLTLGGIDTVRGYRENLRVGDNGLSISSEIRFVLVDEDWTVLEVAPFIDLGTVWNNQSNVPAPNTLLGFGTSLRWSLWDSLFVRLDYGIPVIEEENRGDSLQDNGLFFSVGGRVKF